ncbi:hypothetical protein RUM44_000653 [Polyplax serrata]|uniref:Uncharacterized protein n=1 Tax=Polyplax serrata TaxID=468196 RepID=A0ABR1B6Z9_POLSC
MRKERRLKEKVFKGFPGLKARDNVLLFSSSPEISLRGGNKSEEFVAEWRGAVLVGGGRGEGAEEKEKRWKGKGKVLTESLVGDKEKFKRERERGRERWTRGALEEKLYLGGNPLMCVEAEGHEIPRNSSTGLYVLKLVERAVEKARAEAEEKERSSTRSERSSEEGQRRPGAPWGCFQNLRRPWTSIDREREREESLLAEPLQPFMPFHPFSRLVRLLNGRVGFQVNLELSFVFLSQRSFTFAFRTSSPCAQNSFSKSFSTDREVSSKKN